MESAKGTVTKLIKGHMAGVTDFSRAKQPMDGDTAGKKLGK